MTEKEKMLAGELYTADDPELTADAQRAVDWMMRYNNAPTLSPDDRHALLVEGLGGVGLGVTVRSPFLCDYGYNIHIDDRVFINYGCTVLDVVAVHIGVGTQIGPAVQILTADHPRQAALRARMLEYGRPVVIGSNVWVGGGAIILPGVTIGDDAIVGAGSVVTHDVPAGATVAGNPARPLRSRLAPQGAAAT